MTLPKNKSSLRELLSFQGDRTLWAIFFILCAVSLIEVYSAASALTFKLGIWTPILSHAKFLLIGFVCVWIFHNIPCRWFKLWGPAWVILVFMLAYLALFGAKVNDGARWIPVFGIKFQPSEFAKGAVVVIVAIILSTYQTKKGTDKHAFKYIMFFTVITCLLIFSENFSTAGILFIVVLIMMFFGRVPGKQLGKLILALLIAAICGIVAIKVLPINEISKKVKFLHRLDNFASRIDRFTGGSKEELADSTKQLGKLDFDLKKEPQVGHAHIAIAKGGLLGCGPGNSSQRDFLPQAYSDFIFAIIIEELGLVGGAGVVLLYVILLFRASRIANRCERNFPAFVILGLAVLITVQAAVNMSVAVGLIPVTGQPLPLISRGGSSIIVTSIYFGMMISISRFAKKRQTEPGAKPDGVEPTADTTPPSVVNTTEFENTNGMK